MLYRFDLTVAANVPESSPTRRRVQLVPGKIVHIQAFFPPNSAGLLRAGVEYRGSKVWPSNPDGWLLGDNFAWPWQEDFDLDADDAGLVLVGWNEDEAFSHTVYWGFNVLGQQKAGLLARIGQVLGGG